jgi:putative oxidoreductase
MPPRPAPPDPALAVRRAALVLRLALASILLIHGIARIRSGGVAPFGGFLASRGFPAGAALAWGITLFELAAGLALVANRFVRPVCLVYALQIATGIALVHASEGWFVVGLGRNGMEYSVLILCALGALWILAPAATDRIGSRRPSPADMEETRES